MGVGALRRVGREALDVILWPPAALLVALWRYSRSWPRRVPDLARFTRRVCFRRLQSAAAEWADQGFDLVEQGAPWLDRSGRRVHDFCHTGLSSHPFSFPRDPPGVRCSREVTVVYGFDGHLTGRLAELAAALAAAGWTYPYGDLTNAASPAAQGASIAWPLSWAPVPRLRLPDNLKTMPPYRRLPLERWLDMGVGWASQGGAANLRTTTARNWPGDLRTATSTYRPVEVSGTSIADLASRALAGHDHALAIRVEVTYYLNTNINARPGRLRKRLRPVWPDR